MSKKFLILAAVLLTTVVGLVIKINMAYATCGIQTEPQVNAFTSEVSSDQTTVSFYYKVNSSSGQRCNNPLYISLENVPNQPSPIGIITEDGDWSGTVSGYTDSYSISGLSNGTYGVKLNAHIEGTNVGYIETTSFTISRPICDAWFTPSSITRGEKTTAYWTSSNDADDSLSYSCNGDIGSSPPNLSPANSSTEVYPTQTQTCTLTATSSAGSATCSATITVNPPITYTLNIDAALYPNSDCTGSAGDMGSAASSTNYDLSTPTGAITHGVGNLSVSLGTYSITGAAAIPSGYKYCSASPAATFDSTTQNQTKTVTGYFAPLPGVGAAPTAFLDATPRQVAPGGVPVMTWSSTNAQNCSVLTGPGFHTNGQIYGSTDNQASLDGGATPPYPLVNTITFSIRCYKNADKSGVFDDASVTVTVVSVAPKITVDAIGECQQNYPSSAVQSYISWNSVLGAALYKVMAIRPLIDRTVGTTSEYSIIDGSLSFGSSYDYYVIAYGQLGNEITRSDTTSATTPSSCSAPPSCSGGTYVITPSSQSINVDDTAQFISLYDPDGGGGSRYGNFDVSGTAPWTSGNLAVATSQGSGLFKGIAAGTALIHSTFCSITANGSLNVSNVSQPDFTCSVTPNLQEVQKPGSTDYAISITSLNGFGNPVTLSVSNLPNGVSGSPSPKIINNLPGNSTLTLDVASSAGVGRSTFIVSCKSGTLTHSANADINVTVPPGAFSCAVSASPTSISVGDSTTATASALGGSGGYQYQFVWGDGSPNSPVAGYNVLNQRSHPYSSAGTYTINVNAKDSSGSIVTCSTQTTATNVYVGPPLPPSCQGTLYFNGTVYICGGTPIPCSLNEIGKTSGNAPLFVSFVVRINSTDYTDFSYHFIYGDVQYYENGQRIDYGFESSSSSDHTYTYAGPFTPSVEVHGRQSGLFSSGTCSAPTINVSEISAGCTLTASSSSILPGMSSVLSWDCTSPPDHPISGCTITGDSGNTVVKDGNASGNKTVKPSKQPITTYTVICDNNPDLTASTQVKVGFLPVIREIIPR